MDGAVRGWYRFPMDRLACARRSRGYAGIWLLPMAVLLTPLAAAAGDAPGFCGAGWPGWSILGPSEASTDLYNAGLWFAGTGAISFGASASSRWGSVNELDEGIRSGLRGGNTTRRKNADDASDWLLGLSIGVLPTAAVVRPLFRDRPDCFEAYDLLTDFAESVALTVMLTEAAKTISGRKRPYTQECDRLRPPSDTSCGSSDRKKSFFSGHASLAATGAGLTCAWSVKRRVWGDSLAARAMPCVLGSGLALTTGLLRLSADKHWGTDVLTGWAVGAVVGYFDTWGPFDLLTFEAGGTAAEPAVVGQLTPWTGGDVLGGRLEITF